VAVQQAAWPDARVLALRAPGAEPAELDVHGAESSGDAPRWEVRLGLGTARGVAGMGDTGRCERAGA
jgi:hypothetical protein